MRKEALKYVLYSIYYQLIAIIVIIWQFCVIRLNIKETTLISQN